MADERAEELEEITKRCEDLECQLANSGRAAKCYREERDYYRAAFHEAMSERRDPHLSACVDNLLKLRPCISSALLSAGCESDWATVEQALNVLDLLVNPIPDASGGERPRYTMAQMAKMDPPLPPEKEE